MYVIYNAFVPYPKVDVPLMIIIPIAQTSLPSSSDVIGP